MAGMKTKRYTKLSGLAGIALALLVFLAACQDQSSAPTATPAASPGQTLTAPAVTSPAPATSGSAGITVTPAQTATAPAVPSAAPVTPTPLPATPVNSQADPAFNQVWQAVQKLAVQAKSFRYRLQQTGELNSGGSLSRFEAAGNGEFQRPAFHQLLTLKVAGQEQQIEHYGRENQLFQRVVSLVAWRSLQPAVAGPYPGLNQAQGIKAAGKEALNGLNTTKYGWTFPAALLLPATGQPEGLGALSATGIYQSFSGDKTSQAQATIWIDDTTGYIVRYQITTNFTTGDSTLNYSAIYDYADFDQAAVKVEAPGDLPK
ncbi:MAG: hypothetical protein JWP00_4073 [Chloroflexi bacterium]|nr:hypothetical protein [Chloroflexota bacterium]